MNKHTPGNWYVAERTMWHAEVRFVRTSEDKSGVVGLTNDRDAKLVAAAPELLSALTNLLNWGREHTSPSHRNSPHELLVAAHEAIEKAGGSVPAIERGEGVAITEQRTDAKITELIRDVNDGDCALSAIFDDGSTRKLFNFYIDELAFFDADLIGKTQDEAHQLHHARTLAYLQLD